MNNTQLRNDIQGLRAIAVLSVIIFHLNKYWLPGGFIGVDIFFVISGFLITSIILRKKSTHNFSISDFYIGRLQRIAPAYLVLLIVISLCAAAFFIPSDFNSFKKSAKAALYFNSNYFFAKDYDYFAPAAHELPLLHTWSLAIEMQFYLLLPAVLILIPKRLLAPALLLITTLLLIRSEFKLHGSHQQEVYFSLAARIPEFLIGSLTALIPREDLGSKRASNLLACLGLILIASSFFLITENQSFPGLLALPSCIGVALLLKSQKSIFNQVLSCAPLVFLGALSYSLYLWHWPILAFIRYLSGTYDLSVLSTLIFLTLTLLCAYASYRFIESPFRKKSSTRSTLVRITTLVAASIAAITVASLINLKLVDPWPENLTQYAPDADICHGHITGDCIRGDKTSSTTLLMLGDSHGAQLNYFSDVVGNSIHSKIKIITASSCVTIPGFDAERIVEGARKSCLSQIDEGRKYTANADGIIIAGMWQFQTPSAKFMEQLDKFLTDAATRNQHVLVLAQIPMLASNPQRLDRAEKLGLHLSYAMNEEWVAANSRIKDLVSHHQNATFLDLSSNEFFSKVPLQDNTLIYQDTHHLNEVGSARYGAVAAPYIKDFLDGISTSNASSKSSE